MASFLKTFLKKHGLDLIDSSSSHETSIAFLAILDVLKKSSPTICDAIINELKAQRESLKLIASENYSSLAVQLAMGNWLTDKYAEGFAHHRFYAGCENVDHIEEEANDLAKKLFCAEHAYAQPHSGADANLVAFWAILTQKIQNPLFEKLGKKTLDELSADEHEKIRKEMMNQRLLGLSLASGGHLTHGFRQNFSSKMMQAFSYDVDPKTCELDYASIERKAKEVKPLILLAGYSAYSRKINFAKMKAIADSVGATFMVDMAHFAGLVAGKVFQGEYNPIPYADIVTTTTHKTLRGPRGGLILCKKEFSDVVNKGCPLALGGPLPHVMAAKAIAFREALDPSFQNYAEQIVKNSQALAIGLKQEGIDIVTEGTDNHLLVVNLTKTHLTGRQAESALRSVGITLNRNMIPFDPQGAWYTSGIRMGPAALTTRGMKEKEMFKIASWIAETIRQVKPDSSSRAKYQFDAAEQAKIQTEIRELMNQFPLYPEVVLE